MVSTERQETVGKAQEDRMDHGAYDTEESWRNGVARAEDRG